MKKKLCLLLAVMMVFGLAACNTKVQNVKTEEGYKPSLDTAVEGRINVAGGYDNFEALETEFDRFNEYYPNVELVYTKIDDYNNMIGTVLEGNDAPDIYVNNSWMYGREQYQTSMDHAEDLSNQARICPIRHLVLIWNAFVTISFLRRMTGHFRWFLFFRVPMECL